MIAAAFYCLVAYGVLDVHDFSIDCPAPCARRSMSEWVAERSDPTAAIREDSYYVMLRWRTIPTGDGRYCLVLRREGAAIS